MSFDCEGVDCGSFVVQVVVGPEPWFPVFAPGFSVPVCAACSSPGAPGWRDAGTIVSRSFGLAVVSGWLGAVVSVSAYCAGSSVDFFDAHDAASAAHPMMIHPLMSRLLPLSFRPECRVESR